MDNLRQGALRLVRSFTIFSLINSLVFMNTCILVLLAHIIFVIGDYIFIKLKQDGLSWRCIVPYKNNVSLVPVFFSFTHWHHSQNKCFNRLPPGLFSFFFSFGLLLIRYGIVVVMFLLQDTFCVQLIHASLYMLVSWLYFFSLGISCRIYLDANLNMFYW